MKALIGFIVIIFISALIYFFTSNNNQTNNIPTEVDKLNEIETDEQSGKTEEEEIQEEEENSLAVPTSKIKIDQGNEKDSLDQQEDDEIKDYENDEGDIQIDETPEYGEEVSSEDFKEFIGVALEELTTGDEMAEAIIIEMDKIAKAQPDHIEQVRFFYRECSKNPSISSENQQLCSEYLGKLNE